MILLAASRRSYRFPHQSPWIAVVTKVLLLLPLLLGAIDETRTVTGLVFRQYAESAAERPLVRMYVCTLLLLLCRCSLQLVVL